jgi:hypothetical protein
VESAGEKKTSGQDGVPDEVQCSETVSIFIYVLVLFFIGSNLPFGIVIAAFLFGY